jgi:divalent metal cation (Fe/Co/Zn/Cd) transporter
MFLVMGNSQTMKTAWVEDMLSLTPPISFLIATRLVTKKPNDQFPFGYHWASSISYLVSALALFSTGGFLLIDSLISLTRQEHPTIGIVVLFGHSVWLGYFMIIAMIYATIPAIFLGRIKLPLAEHLPEKNLYTDAKMNKADWMTAMASIVGVAGISMGW